ncbi:hypothetical protein QQ045_016767 [Rhodiola kirilowii]
MVPDFEEQDTKALYFRYGGPQINPFLNIQLYEKALDLFEEDPPTSVILHKHLLRTVLASIVIVVLVDLDKA